jgi:putative zinc finger protein
MDPARSDRAERHVFAALPDLDAVPRRGLALTVAGVPRAGVASDLGLAGAELLEVLATARKSLRRTRTELPSGGRCERAERVLSDRLDGATSPMDERFFEAHLRRCARCRTHATELDAALETLRTELAAPPKPVGARLRVVPPLPQLPRAPEPVAHVDVPPPFAPAHPAPPSPTVVEEAPVATSAAPTPAPAPHPSRIRAALPIAVAALIAIGLIAAAIALLGYRHDDNKGAPWNAPNAPVVHPAPISAQ